MFSFVMFSRRWFKILSVIVLLGASLALWAFFFEPAFGHHVRTHKLAIAQSSPSLSGLRIAVLTDLHIGSAYNGVDKLERIVDMVNAEKPDLILLPGDFVIQGVVGGSYVAPSVMANYLRKLSAPLGVYAVLGNHDHWLNEPTAFDAFENNGVKFLTNKSIKLSFRNEEFWLAGVDDLWSGKPDITAALEAIPEASPVIVFTHNPDLFPEIPPRVLLTIAGHTHGGQVYFPIIGRLIVPSKFGERYAVGHIVESGKNLFVGQGTGTSILPVRFLVPPEISILELN